MMKHVLLISIATLNFGCTSRPALNSGTVTFRLVRGASVQTPAGTQAKFVFQNGTRTSIPLPGYFRTPPSNGEFQPSLVEYDYISCGEWRELQVGYDVVPEDFDIAPNSAITLLISVGPAEHQKVPRNAPMRVRIGEFISETFTIEDVLGSGFVSEKASVKAGKE